MKKMIVVVSTLFFLLVVSYRGTACEKTEPLFVIERSKNGNVVHYDACIEADDSLSDTDPVIVYWVLEDGRKEDLIRIERDRAYGIVLRERRGKRRVGLSIVSLKEREITVDKIGHRYRALMRIDGKECVLERIYLKSRDLMFGLPIVEFVDVFGRTKEGGHAVTERIDKPRM